MRFVNENEVRIELESSTGPQGPVGPAGPQGPQGERGPAGPIGMRGEQGAQGIAGEKGERGVGVTKVLRTAGDGSPGTSDEYTTYYDDGAMSIHYVYNGKDGADGAQGPAGPAGVSGSTPARGTDYWTEADKAEIVNDVLASLPSAEGVSY
ncbi:MAG: collagen-like protein [Clostridia bacterium]|nr:collagen-like protein [Clostridia bacterium]